VNQLFIVGLKAVLLTRNLLRDTVDTFHKAGDRTMSSYVIWANKGGIGKSTLSFQLSCKYARLNPHVPVVVIDLSPQCDVTRMMLGGGKWDGEGKILGIMGAAQRKTVYQYLRECVRDVPNGLGWPNAANFILSPNAVRDPQALSLPDNLYLFSGDFDLERVTHDMEAMQQPPRRGGMVPSGADYSKYLLPRSFLKKAVEQIRVVYPDAKIIIDTDPYYSVITTHLGLLAAEYLITAYSPSSQASQYAVYRSLEFLNATGYSLSEEVERQKQAYPRPWYDQRDQLLDAPDVQVPTLKLLLSNMTTSKAPKGGKRYSQPQQLHKQTIAAVTTEVDALLTKFNITTRPTSEHVWALQRLGLICDYNGIDMTSIVVGIKYHQPDLSDMYRVDRSTDNKLQVDAYNERLEVLAALL